MQYTCSLQEISEGSGILIKFKGQKVESQKLIELASKMGFRCDLKLRELFL